MIYRQDKHFNQKNWQLFFQQINIGNIPQIQQEARQNRILMLRPKSAILLSIPPSFAQTKDVVTLKRNIRKCFQKYGQQFDQSTNKTEQNTFSTIDKQTQQLSVKQDNLFTETVHNVVYKTRHQYSQSLYFTNKKQQATNRSCTYSFMNQINKNYQCSGMASSVIKVSNRPYHLKNPNMNRVPAPKAIRKMSCHNLRKQLQKARLYHALLQQKHNQILKKKKQDKDDLSRIKNTCLLINKICNIRKEANQSEADKCAGLSNKRFLFQLKNQATQIKSCDNSNCNQNINKNRTFKRKCKLNSSITLK